MVLFPEEETAKTSDNCEDIQVEVSMDPSVEMYSIMVTNETSRVQSVMAVPKSTLRRTKTTPPSLSWTGSSSSLDMVGNRTRSPFRTRMADALRPLSPVLARGETSQMQRGRRGRDPDKEYRILSPNPSEISDTLSLSYHTEDEEEEEVVEFSHPLDRRPSYTQSKLLAFDSLEAIGFRRNASCPPDLRISASSDETSISSDDSQGWIRPSQSTGMPMTPMIRVTPMIPMMPSKANKPNKVKPL